MRSPERIDKFLARLSEVWKKMPDMRFMQMIALIRFQSEKRFGLTDIYYLEENQLEEVIEDILKNGEAV
jgi:hypothetical protein